jgi:ribosomal protein S27E
MSSKTRQEIHSHFPVSVPFVHTKKVQKFIVWYHSKRGFKPGLIMEGTTSIQVICPDCDYGKGTAITFFEPYRVVKLIKCKNCGKTFIGFKGTST